MKTVTMDKSWNTTGVNFFMWICAGPCSEHVFGVTYPADGAEALVDPLVPVAGSCVLVFGRQSFVTSVEICRDTRRERRDVRAGNKQPAVIPDMAATQTETSACQSAKNQHFL